MLQLVGHVCLRSDLCSLSNKLHQQVLPCDCILTVAPHGAAPHSHQCMIDVSHLAHVAVLQTVIFVPIVYFMVGFEVDAGKFW